MTSIETLRRQFQSTGPDQDTEDRALWRIDQVFALFYDVDGEEPEIAFRDLLTDLEHAARLRDVDLEGALESALIVAEEERREWEARDELRAQNDDPPFEEHTDRMARLAEDDAVRGVAA